LEKFDQYFKQHIFQVYIG